MRFTTAWAKVAAQNVSLKVATILLALVTVCQLGVIASIASKDALVVERGCFSKTTGAKASDPTQDEIRAFLNEALPLRFDSSAYIKNGFLSIEELTAQEQAALKERQMLQKILVGDVQFANKEILVSTDRLISIGKVKSALPLALKVTIQQTNRTESNPYGLILTSVNEFKEQKDEVKQ
jgi:hypothetical protein